jgi:flagellar biosynthesis anti-sigma factor FlgM
MAIKNISGQSPSAISSSKAGESSNTKNTKNVDGLLTPSPKGPASNTGAKGVEVAVSDKAKLRASEQKLAKEVAMKSPEIREDKVAAIKAQIDAGTYKIDSQKIADGMMKEAVIEHLAKEGS